MGLACGLAKLADERRLSASSVKTSEPTQETASHGLESSRLSTRFTFAERFMAALLCLPIFGAASVGAPAQIAKPRPAPAFEAGQWLNWVGETPSVDSLKRRTVILLLFSAKADSKKAFWPVLREYEHENKDKGLVILALCPESPAEAKEYLRHHNLPFAVGAGENVKQSMGTGADFYQVLVDPEGGVVWEGPTNGLWNGKLMEGMRGAKRFGDRAILVFHPKGVFGKLLSHAIDNLADGEISKALKAIDVASADPHATDEDKKQSDVLRSQVEEHVVHLLAQIEDLIQAREVLPATQDLTVIAKELRDHDLGKRAATRSEELAKDAAFQKETKAAKTYEEIYDDFQHLGLKKNAERLKKFSEDFAGTRAAEKAANILAGR